MKSLVILPLFFLATFAAFGPYDFNQMWRITFPEEFTEWEEFNSAIQKMELDVWSHGKNWMDVRVTPPDFLFLAAIIKEKGLEVEVKIKDVGKLIQQQKEDHDKRAKPYKQPRASIQLDVYHSLLEIYDYLDALEVDNANMVTTEVVGTTYGGVDLRLVRIFAPGTTGEGQKEAVWIDCGIHAREWITPATCIWGIDNFVTAYGVDDTVTRMLDTYDFYILPVLNAEGYDYSWTDERLWRKNRRFNEGYNCYGVDLNRNYDDGHWGGDGSSPGPCTDTYHGTSGFSEAETSAVRDKVNYLQRLVPGVKTFYSIHSYGQLWMYVFGCCLELTADRADLDATAAAGVAALEAVHGTQYQYGDHYTTIYQASGVSIDWSYRNASVNFSFLMELRDEGEYGFLLPEDQIIPTAEESWAGIFAAIDYQP